MRVLFCKWNGVCEKGIESAFVRLGFQVDSCFYEFAGADYSSECLELLQAKLSANQYDFVFSHNFIPIVSKVCQIYRIKYISWVMDSPAYHLYSSAIRNCCNYIFIFDRLLYQEFAEQNPGHIFYYPLATCMYEWEETKKKRHPNRNYDADVSFLGSMYVQECHYDEVQGMPDYMRGYFDGIMEAQLQVYGYNFLEEVLSEEMAEEFADVARWTQTEDYTHNYKNVVSQVYLGQKCTQIERLRIAEAIADAGMDFKLYTHSPLPRNLSKYNQGTAGYYEEMPFIFRDSKINLNITSKSIRNGLPLRMFDIMGCGGFLLTNYQAELPEYFDVGKDLVVYESIPHLLEMITYYLEHDEERREIAENGYHKVKQYFSFDVAIIDILRQSEIISEE
ncbi:MAG: glycosyltransferase [Lachnospiraceae bacterium]|nr:glycosyltransferase [Lachnospiraceae bacterium]